jgi:hypothetical protein
LDNSLEVSRAMIRFFEEIDQARYFRYRKGFAWAWYGECYMKRYNVHGEEIDVHTFYEDIDEDRKSTMDQEDWHAFLDGIIEDWYNDLMSEIENEHS